MQTQIHKMALYLEYAGLILILLLSTALAGCPSKCVCSNSAVHCTHKSLIDVPNFESLHNDPIVIDLSSNDIDFIPYYGLSFDKAEIVQILYLNDSKIIDMDDGVFKELINLRELYLSNNLLSDLPPKEFKYNDNLTHLDLSYNLFRNMPKIISKSLRTLNLINAGIQNVETDRFIDLPNLKYLNLERNNIRFLELNIFKYLPKLNLIELEYNAWKCTCESVQLFQYLKNNRLVNVKEQIQCKTENDFFITIFNKTGIPEPVEDLCNENKQNTTYNFGGELDEEKELRIMTNHLEKSNKKLLNQYRKNKKPKSKIQETSKFKSQESIASKCSYIEYTSPFTFTTYVIFYSSLFLAFVIGLILGTMITDKKRNVSDDSASHNSLLKREGII